MSSSYTLDELLGSTANNNGNNSSPWPETDASLDTASMYAAHLNGYFSNNTVSPAAGVSSYASYSENMNQNVAGAVDWTVNEEDENFNNRTLSEDWITESVDSAIVPDRSDEVPLSVLVKNLRNLLGINGELDLTGPFLDLLRELIPRLTEAFPNWNGAEQYHNVEVPGIYTIMIHLQDFSRAAGCRDHMLLPSMSMKKLFDHLIKIVDKYEALKDVNLDLYHDTHRQSLRIENNAPGFSDVMW